MKKFGALLLFCSLTFSQDAIVVSPSTLDFGNVLMGNTPTQTFTLTCNLDQTISITPPSFYSVDITEIAMVSGQTQDIVVTFDPPQVGVFNSQVVLAGSTFGTGIVNVNATAVNNLEGSLSGTISADFSPYEISGDIYVAEGNTLDIEPGVELLFNGSYSFVVNGVLNAIGSPDSLIIFKTTESNKYWNGLSFNNSDASVLVYCSISDVGDSFIFSDNFNNLNNWEGGSVTIDEYISPPFSLTYAH